MSNWKSSLITQTASLAQAIEAIDQGAMRIALVADSGGKLLGTLTDGDIRRALLAHRPLSTAANEIMCHSPTVVGPSLNKDRVMALMNQKQILHVPIVNQDGVLIGLHTLHDLVGRKTRPNAVFLMAGGFGTRLHPLTNSCPKPMLKVGGKPIIENILERFIEHGFSNFYISTHYLAEMIKEHFGDGSSWGVDISYTQEDSPLGTAGALQLLPKDQIRDSFIVMNADLLTTLSFSDLLEFHTQHDGIATMCVRQYSHTVPYGVIEGNGSKIVSMVEKPNYNYFINSGVYALSPEVLGLMKVGEIIDMPTLLERAISKGEVVNMFPVREYWLDIGQMKDFERAQEEYKLVAL